MLLKKNTRLAQKQGIANLHTHSSINTPQKNATFIHFIHNFLTHIIFVD